MASFNYGILLENRSHENTLRVLIGHLNRTILNDDPNSSIIRNNEATSQTLRNYIGPRLDPGRLSDFTFEYAEAGLTMTAVIRRLSAYNQLRRQNNLVPITLNSITQTARGIGMYIQNNFDSNNNIDEDWQLIVEKRTIENYFSEASSIVWLDAEQLSPDYKLTVENIQKIVTANKLDRNEVKEILMRLINSFLPEHYSQVKEKNADELARYLIDSQHTTDKKLAYQQKLAKLTRKVGEPLRKVIQDTSNIAQLIYNDEREAEALRNDKILKIKLKALVAFTIDPLSSQLLTTFKKLFRNQCQIDFEQHLQLVEEIELDNGLMPQVNLTFDKGAASTQLQLNNMEFLPQYLNPTQPTKQLYDMKKKRKKQNESEIKRKKSITQITHDTDPRTVYEHRPRTLDEWRYTDGRRTRPVDEQPGFNAANLVPDMDFPDEGRCILRPRKS